MPGLTGTRHYSYIPQLAGRDIKVIVGWVDLRKVNCYCSGLYYLFQAGLYRKVKPDLVFVPYLIKHRTIDEFTCLLRLYHSRVLRGKNAFAAYLRHISSFDDSLNIKGRLIQVLVFDQNRPRHPVPMTILLQICGSQMKVPNSALKLEIITVCCAIFLVLSCSAFSVSTYRAGRCVKATFIGAAQGSPIRVVNLSFAAFSIQVCPIAVLIRVYLTVSTICPIGLISYPVQIAGIEKRSKKIPNALPKTSFLPGQRRIPVQCAGIYIFIYTYIYSSFACMQY